MFWNLSKDGKEVINITRCEMIRAGDRTELKNHPSQDVEHGSKGCIHKGNDVSAALVVLLFFLAGM